MTATVSVSQYHGKQEVEYVTFTLPAQGDECREYLSTRMTPGNNRTVAHWQFDQEWETAFAVGQAVLAGRYEEAARLANADPVRV